MDQIIGTDKTSSFDELKQQADDSFHKKDYEAAIKSYKKALMLQIDSPEILLGLAHAYLNAEYFEEAFKAADKVRGMRCKDVKQAWGLMGRSVYGMRDWDLSVELFEDALKLYPNTKELQVELAKAKARLHESRRNTIES